MGPGLYQINVAMPSNLTLGQELMMVGLSSNFETQPNAFLCTFRAFRVICLYLDL